MFKKSCFRGSFDKRHDKRAEKLLKSERQHLHHINRSLQRQVRLKLSLWMISKILGHFFKPLTADDKYSLLIRDNSQQHFQMQLSQKRKIFSEFSFAFSKLRFNFEYFLNKMTLIGDVFLNLRTQKDVVR